MLFYYLISFLFHAAFGACNHRGVCAVCFARLRGVMRDRACPVCKQEQEMVICSAEAKSFQSFEIFGYDLGPEYTFDERSHMFYPKHYFRHDVSNTTLCMRVKYIAKSIYSNEILVIKHRSSPFGFLGARSARRCGRTRRRCESTSWRTTKTGSCVCCASTT